MLIPQPLLLRSVFLSKNAQIHARLLGLVRHCLLPQLLLLSNAFPSKEAAPVLKI
jgi:hypothetical protein